MAKFDLDALLYLMARLRDPELGCPWDIKQDYLSITPSTIEEAYEVVDAIERQDLGHLKEELGDLLFQVIFYSQLASEEKRFTFHDVVDVLTAKLVRRHPHVFPDGTLESQREPGQVLDEQGVKASWEAIKQSERSEKGAAGVFDDIPASLPGLTRAWKLQKRAAKLGFDWSEPDPILDKLEEELTELCEAYDQSDDAAIADELADLMFTCVNLSRHMGLDPDGLMRRANQKFTQRFSHVVENVGDDGFDGRSLDELEVLWEQAKASERQTEREPD